MIPGTAQSDDETRRRELLNYAWNWFRYHAEQRTSMFNYSLVAFGLLAAGFGTVIGDEMWGAAAAIGAVGFLIGLSFVQIDHRNHQLVRRGEEVLEALEKELFAIQPKLRRTRPEQEELNGMLQDDHRLFPDGASHSLSAFVKNYRWGKHGTHLRLIERFFCAAFLIGGLLALLRPDFLRLHESNPSQQVTARVEELTRAVGDLNGRLDVLNLRLAATTEVAPVGVKRPHAHSGANPPPPSQPAR